MKIVAITTEGTEYLYRASSAHTVPVRSAQKIADILNKVRFDLSKDAEIWHVYDVADWEIKYTEASFQRFTIRKGIVRRIFC